ncbi:MAG: indole-3-glycerol phosphate synthase TrpC [Dehalococcoidia bacterium]|jgi:indole-3-glycerol phosphate synthase|nr:indole-3-glycerol phosphate synthase TrpC [Dehalococcoidia bacterium]
MITRTYLDRILPRTTEDLAVRRADVPDAEIRSRALDSPEPTDFGVALGDNRLHLIAEVKRASPSKGDLAPNLNPLTLARTYADNGASAISVLTDTPFFKGSLEDLRTVKDEVVADGIPVLRKDFIVDPYQVYEARLWGADAFLLIAACLTDEQLAELHGLGRELRMAALVEVHDEEELFRVEEIKPNLVGINNRDLRTFETDPATTHGLAPRVPFLSKVVSESGIHTREDARLMRAAGADAVLVGEALIVADDTAAAVRELSSVGDPSLSTIVMEYGPPDPEFRPG